jgi:glycosyltransferase involved in cell wall biosynthesis
MHILLIHQAFAALNEPGGTRHYELARILAQRGHRVTVVASPISYLTGAQSAPRGIRLESAESGQITILRTYAYSAIHRSFLHRVIGFLSFMATSFLAGLKVSKVDLVWGTSPPIFQGVTAWLLARLKRVPFLLEVRDLWPAFAVEVGVLKQPAIIRASEWLESFLYRHADQMIVNSPGFIDHVRARGGQDIELVPNGADPRMFDPHDRGAAFRQKHDLQGKFIALYAGAHGLSNDLGILLEAAERLKDDTGIAIVLLGDGKEKPALMASAASRQLNNVTFIDSVPKTEMAQALAASDLCIAILKPIPLYATVYPNKVFDYMAAGRPVLLAIDGVIREVVEKAQAGVFCSPGDPESLAAAIQKLSQDPQWVQSMGNCGREYIEAHFDRAALGERLAEIIEAIGTG